jgi:hypothetical protein
VNGKIEAEARELQPRCPSKTVYKEGLLPRLMASDDERSEICITFDRDKKEKEEKRGYAHRQSRFHAKSVGLKRSPSLASRLSTANVYRTPETEVLLRSVSSCSHVLLMVP